MSSIPFTHTTPDPTHTSSITQNPNRYMHRSPRKFQPQNHPIANDRVVQRAPTWTTSTTPARSSHDDADANADANDARDVRHVDGFDAAGVKQQQSDDGQEAIGRGDEVRARRATRCDARNGMARGRQPRAAGSLRDRWMDGWMDGWTTTTSDG